MSWLRVARTTGDTSYSSGAADGASAVSDDILASALEDLEAGLTPLEVLDRYPDHEADLAPLLQTAYELLTTRWPAMSMAGRVAGRERMQAALAAQKRSRGGWLSPFWRQVGVTLALLVMAGAAFLASPLSPLDLRREADAVPPTATDAAPAVLPPTATIVVPKPTASATPTSTATPAPTRRIAVTVEPSETTERLILAGVTRVPTETPTPANTATSRATRGLSPTAVATASATPTATVTATAEAATAEAPAATQPPAPTAMPTSTPSPPAPSPTATLLPTDTARPTATVTLTREPIRSPTATPVPSTPTATPHPWQSRTPEPTKTPELTDDAPGQTVRASVATRVAERQQADPPPRLALPGWQKRIRDPHPQP